MKLVRNSLRPSLSLALSFAMAVVVSGGGTLIFCAGAALSAEAAAPSSRPSSDPSSELPADVDAEIESTMPDEPIGELKRPAGSGDEYPGDDQLFDDQGSKGAALEVDVDVPDTSGFDPDERRQLSEFKLGPTVAAGVPHPLTYGLEFRHGGRVGGAFSLGSLNTKVAGTSLSLSNWDVRLRWFPWRSSFFGGLAFGQQKASGEVKREDVNGGAVGTVDTTMKLTAKTTYATPHVGWSTLWHSGFTLGFDVGVQVPLTSKEEFSAKFGSNLSADQEALIKASDDYKKLEADAKDVAKKVGNTILPYVTLVRMGWLL